MVADTHTLKIGYDLCIRDRRKQSYLGVSISPIHTPSLPHHPNPPRHCQRRSSNTNNALPLPTPAPPPLLPLTLHPPLLHARRPNPNPRLLPLTLRNHPSIRPLPRQPERKIRLTGALARVEHLLHVLVHLAGRADGAGQRGLDVVLVGEDEDGDGLVERDGGDVGAVVEVLDARGRGVGWG